MFPGSQKQQQQQQQNDGYGLSSSSPELDAILLKSIVYNIFTKEWFSLFNFDFNSISGWQECYKVLQTQIFLT